MEDLKYYQKKYGINFRVTGVIVCIVITLLSSCPNRKNQIEKVTMDLCLQANLEENETMDLSDCLDQAWDSVLVVGPYADLSRVENSINRSFPYQIHQTKISMRDDISLLIFFDGQDAKYYSIVNRGIIDLTRLSRGPINREDATIKLVTKGAQQWRYATWVDSGTGK